MCNNICQLVLYTGAKTNMFRRCLWPHPQEAEMIVTWSTTSSLSFVLEVAIQLSVQATFGCVSRISRSTTMRTTQSEQRTCHEGLAQISPFLKAWDVIVLARAEKDPASLYTVRHRSQISGRSSSSTKTALALHALCHCVQIIWKYCAKNVSLET